MDQHMIFWLLSYCQATKAQRACATTKTRQSLHCSDKQSMGVDIDSDHNLDPVATQDRSEWRV